MTPQFPELETPALLVERPILERNLEEMAEVARRNGVTLRPHAKTHKSPLIGRLQVERGSPGLTVATLAEAEAMADAGIDDLLIAYPPVGEWRLRRLEKVAERTQATVTVDSEEAVKGLAKAGAALGRELAFLWKVDSGLHRMGTPPREPSAEAVASVLGHPGTRFRGLMTHAGHAYGASSTEDLHAVAREEGRSVVDTAELLRDRGIPVEVVSVGSTPTARVVAEVSGVTEIRPGTYVFNDATQVALGVVGPEHCAQTVLATVVGRPAPDRAVVDSGSKALPRDVLTDRTTGYGLVVDHPELVVDRLYEEHAVLVAPEGRCRLEIGQRVRIISNHCCTATSLHPRFYLVDGDRVEEEVPVMARDWRGDRRADLTRR
ncbi:MAG: alanine racemase [Actinomycetota bacterium]